MSNNYPYNNQPRRGMFPSINPRDNARVPDYATINHERRPQEVWMIERQQPVEGAPIRKRNKRRPLYRPIAKELQTNTTVVPRVADKYPMTWKPTEVIDEDEHDSYSESVYDLSAEQILPTPPVGRPTQQRRVVRTRGAVPVKLPAIVPVTNQAVGIRPQVPDGPPNPRGGCLTNEQILKMSNRHEPSRARARVTCRPGESSVTVQEEPRLPTLFTKRNNHEFGKYMNRPSVRNPVQPYPDRYVSTGTTAAPSRAADKYQSTGPSQYTYQSQCPSQYSSTGQTASDVISSVGSSPDLDSILQELL